MKPFPILLFLGLAALLAGCQDAPTPVQAVTTPPAPQTRLQAKSVSALPPLPMALAVPQPVALVTAAATNPATPTVTLAWDPSPGAAGYRIYQGVASRVYTNNVDAGSATNATVPVPAGMTSYFAATAYGSNGVQSTYSAEVSFTTPAATQKKTVAVIKTFVEVSTNNQFNGWIPVQAFMGMASTNPAPTFPDVTLTDPPPLIFFRTRIAVDYTNSP